LDPLVFNHDSWKSNPGRDRRPILLWARVKINDTDHHKRKESTTLGSFLIRSQERWIGNPGILLFIY